jgi:hypothetical protein
MKCFLYLIPFLFIARVFAGGVCTNEFGQCGLSGNSNGIGCNYATAPGSCACACDAPNSNDINAVCVANPFPGISCQNIGNSCPPPPECYEVICNLFDNCCEYYYIPGCQVVGQTPSVSPTPSATPLPTFSGSCPNNPQCVAYAYFDPVIVGSTGYTTFSDGPSFLFTDPDPSLIKDCNDQFTVTCSCACIPHDYAAIAPGATEFANGTCAANAKPGIPVSYIDVGGSIQPVCPTFECFRNLFSVKWFLQGEVYGNPICCEYDEIPGCVIASVSSTPSLSASVEPSPSITPSPQPTATRTPSASTQTSTTTTTTTTSTTTSTTTASGSTTASSGTVGSGAGVNVRVNVTIEMPSENHEEEEENNGGFLILPLLLFVLFACIIAAIAWAASNGRTEVQRRAHYN